MLILNLKRAIKYRTLGPEPKRIRKFLEGRSRSRGPGRNCFGSATLVVARNKKKKKGENVTSEWGKNVKRELGAKLIETSLGIWAVGKIEGGI